MLGELILTPAGRVRTERETVCGAALLTVSARARPRALSLAARQLRRAGLRRAAAPETPLCRQILSAAGIEAVTERDALPILAARLTHAVLQTLFPAPEAVSVALWAGRRSRWLDRAALELAETVREGRVETPDGAALRRYLRSRFGLADRSGCPGDFSLVFDPLPETLPQPPGLWLSRTPPPSGWHGQAGLTAVLRDGTVLTDGARIALLLTTGLLPLGAVAVTPQMPG